MSQVEINNMKGVQLPTQLREQLNIVQSIVADMGDEVIKAYRAVEPFKTVKQSKYYLFVVIRNQAKKREIMVGLPLAFKGFFLLQNTPHDIVSFVSLRSLMIGYVEAYSQQNIIRQSKNIYEFVDNHFADTEDKIERIEYELKPEKQAIVDKVREYLDKHTVGTAEELSEYTGVKPTVLYGLLRWITQNEDIEYSSTNKSFCKVDNA